MDRSEAAPRGSGARPGGVLGSGKVQPAERSDHQSDAEGDEDGRHWRVSSMTTPMMKNARP